MRINDMRMA